MAEITEEIKGLKRLARNQSDQGNYELAAKTLHDAIDLLEEALTRLEGHLDNAGAGSVAADGAETALAETLADLYGMLGGARRKQGDLARSIAAYDQGFRYESNPRYGIVNTYNALNRLVTRILLHPASLSDPEALRGLDKSEFVDVQQTLAELQTELEQQVDGIRSNDFWAAGDLAFTCALNGDVEGALYGLQRFESCSPAPSPSDYSAYSDWIGEVSKLDTPRQEALSDLKVLFDKRMGAA